MLKKALRLQKKEDFDRIFRLGRPIFFGPLALRYSAKKSPGFRLGFSLSKKYLPRAVERNRLRRVLSELMAEKRSEWPESADVVICLRRRPAAISKKDLDPAVSALLRSCKRQ